MFNYPAVFRREGKGYVVRVPDLPEVVTEGDTVGEATAFAADAIEGVLAEYVSRKRDIPVPRSAKRGMRVIRLPLLTQAKLSLYMALRKWAYAKRISLVAWASRKLRWSGCWISTTPRASTRSRPHSKLSTSNSRSRFRMLRKST